MIGLPKEMKEFGVWLNPRSLAAFNKMEILRLAKNAWTSMAPTLSDELMTHLSEGLLETEEDQAQFALRLYFYQLRLHQSISLDLRRSRFQYDKCWRFKGQTLAHAFDVDTVDALMETYRIFYTEPGASLLPSLKKMNLVPDHWSAEQEHGLENIFEAHFDQGSSGKMKFEFSQLLQSFTKIFQFIHSNKGKVPSEFAMLGVYLSSLYMNLETVSCELDVKAAYQVATSESLEPQR